MTKIPDNYIERVYAGVLGKLIGVYLGRPFEGWSYQKIMQELGPIHYYVHEHLKQPLVVTDDDVAGTFTFIRALEDYGISSKLTAEDIGRAWLNYIIERRSILWWGGKGNSTEHTAWLNLKKGIPAPLSGAIETNGKAVAEQIGAQIFIDGWALVAPGQPKLAAELAQKAGSVSHDGESVYAAMFWAAIEAQAFISNNIDHLLDIGLTVIPENCLIAQLVKNIRQWRTENDNWEITRQLIQDHYGYDKYPGNCHVVPNHALMLMAILYAPDDFQQAQMIVNTSGWDTDCNAGNVGCFLGIKLGLAGLEAGPDWRGPLADRMLISTADGGNSIHDAVRMAYYLVNIGLQLAKQPPLPNPKEGAQFHFSLPGSSQGFQVLNGYRCAPLKISNSLHKGHSMLNLAYDRLAPGQVAIATTPTFISREVFNMRTYELMATPLVYSGQVVKAHIITDPHNNGSVQVRLCCRVYGEADQLQLWSGEFILLSPGTEHTLEWKLPDFGGQPVGELGLQLEASGQPATGHIWIDYIRWDGCPELVLTKPKVTGDFWRRAWVNGVSDFVDCSPKSFRISQDRGEGLLIHGTRQWANYRVTSKLTVHLGDYGGLAVRVQGLRRYYAIRLTRSGLMQIVRVRDEEITVLAERQFDFIYEKEFSFAVDVNGSRIAAKVDDISLEATDTTSAALRNGGMGLLIAEGALSTDKIYVSAN